MHGVTTRVSIKDFDAAMGALQGQVVPGAKSAPGFVSGTWLHIPENGAGVSLMLFDTEENARAFTDKFEVPAEAPVTLERIYVGEVVAQA
jgi:hypothetical protein